jgi:hypothetical protein
VQLLKFACRGLAYVFRFERHSEKEVRRVAQLVNCLNHPIGGVPRPCAFCKRGYGNADREWFFDEESYTFAALNEIFPQPSLTFTTPDSSSK